MKHLTRTFALLLVLSLLAIGSLSVTALAATQSDNYEVGSKNSTASTARPSCVISTAYEMNENDRLINESNIMINNFSVHNMAIVYDWTTNGKGDELYLSSTNIQYFPMGAKNKRIIVFPYLIGDAECNPSYKYGKIHYSDGTFSDYTTVEFEHYVESGRYYRAIYSFNCLYIPIAHFDPARVAGYMPTSYGQYGYSWEHNTEKNKIIYGSISYGDDIEDFEIPRPSSTVYYEFKLNGVTFNMRVGTSTFSIKAPANTSPETFHFAFGTEKASQNYD